VSTHWESSGAAGADAETPAPSSVTSEFPAELSLRETSVTEREAAVSQRETRAIARQAAQDARAALSRAEEQRDVLLGQMRQANERLVLTALRAQELVDEATEQRAAADTAREKLERTEIALRDASRLKDEFLAMLGHELRNPLAPILTALELMKLRTGGTFVHEREVIERQVRHMVDLIDDLLDVSRIASGKVDLHRTPVEISLVLTKALETAQPLLESRRHTLSVSVPASGLLVDGDSTRLAQVFANLLTNAAKYTEPGGNLRLEARADGPWVRVSVLDDGVGIERGLLPIVFERFVQGPQSIERASGGLGLGLAIVKSMVELHDGEVSVNSAGPGLGSEFVVRLPALDASALVDVSRRRAAAVPASGPPRRVLIVDDNVDAAELLVEYLGARGHRTAMAHDGLEALDKYASFSPDCVVIDIGLPVLDGYEVARRIRQQEEVEPGRDPAQLVALTGYGQASDRRKSAEAGMDAHLVKPVDLSALEAVLAKAGSVNAPPTPPTSLST